VARRKSQHRRFRSLEIEQLDGRRLLAADETSSLAIAEADVSVSAAHVQAAELVDGEFALWGDPGDTELGTLQDDGYGYGYGDGAPPEITNFIRTSLGGGWWVFSGEVVDDEYVEGLPVEFGGLLEGPTVNVQSDGTFEYTCYIDPTRAGLVSAMVTDRDGLESDYAYCYVG
jgi:hypothetical protein